MVDKMTKSNLSTYRERKEKKKRKEMKKKVRSRLRLLALVAPGHWAQDGGVVPASGFPVSLLSLACLFITISLATQVTGPSAMLTSPALERPQD